jgi:hypothetical protein
VVQKNLLSPSTKPAKKNDLHELKTALFSFSVRSTPQYSNDCVANNRSCIIYLADIPCRGLNTYKGEGKLVLELSCGEYSFRWSVSTKLAYEEERASTNPPLVVESTSEFIKVPTVVKLLSFLSPSDFTVKKEETAKISLKCLNRIFDSLEKLQFESRLRKINGKEYAAINGDMEGIVLVPIEKGKPDFASMTSIGSDIGSKGPKIPEGLLEDYLSYVSAMRKLFN